MRAVWKPVIRASDRGLKFVAAHEGWVDHPYNDPTDNATIGYGHLLHMGRVTKHDRDRWGAHITKANGLRILRQDLMAAEGCVVKHCRKIRNQARFDMLVSLCFNIGCGSFASSTLVRKLNAGDNEGARKEFVRWKRSGGHVVEGLLRRRQEEARIFGRGSYLLGRFRGGKR